MALIASALGRAIEASALVTVHLFDNAMVNDVSTVHELYSIMQWLMMVR